MAWWLPARSQQTELLDDALPADAVLAQNLREMAVLYRLTGGFRMGWRLLAPLLTANSCLLDVAAGDASLTRLIARRSGSRIVACDYGAAVSQIAAGAGTPTVQADGTALPFADGSFDVVHCSQALHHFSHAAAVRLLVEATRVAQRGVVFVDLQRSWLGYWGARLAALGPLSALGRHDGPLSVLRAYTLPEVVALAQQANVAVERHASNGIYWGVVLTKRS